ncbi:hypothetical protein AMTR_s00032p00237240 [Amborella trichopoda]|uniref:tRNA-intron lyase n=2 Tax=Amborella trichopoda TaxID=13333 RepID=U5CPF0_AMBTC|nr:hypothetical protein AMTR_s00032p00237240 [Amborella trichopoda]
MEPRWKGKGSAGVASSNPMSKIITQLQSSLLLSRPHALLNGSSVLLEVGSEQTDLLNHACFGRPVITTLKDKQWFQLGFEEAFYLIHSLKCLSVPCGSVSLTSEELWKYMISKKKLFPRLYKAYSHLRSKNWVVRQGSQYGTDFVAYRHHPALVHSEYAVLVLSEKDQDQGPSRLRVWSDWHSIVRVCGSIAKTLLVLDVDISGADESSPSCLERFCVSEYKIARWVPEQHREDHVPVKEEAK